MSLEVQFLIIGLAWLCAFAAVCLALGDMFDDRRARQAEAADLDQRDRWVAEYERRNGAV